MVKLSLLLLYLDLFWVSDSFRVAVYLGIAFDIVYNTVIFATFVFLYVPRNGRTIFETAQTPLFNLLKPLAVAESALDCLTDIYVFVLPIPMIYRLHLPRIRKLGVFAVFMWALL